MKSYTDIEQSKKLAKILLIESADIWWSRCTITDFGDGVLKVSYAVEPCNISQFRNTKEDVPAWSLAALLNAVDFSTINLHYDNARTDWVASATIYDSTKHCTKYESTRALNPIDACVEMILKLHERKML